jgi:hypothetical protein
MPNYIVKYYRPGELNRIKQEYSILERLRKYPLIIKSFK